MDTNLIAASLDDATTKDILTANGQIKRKRTKTSLTERYLQTLRLHAATLLVSWKNNGVPPNVFATIMRQSPHLATKYGLKTQFQVVVQTESSASSAAIENPSSSHDPVSPVSVN